MPKQPPQRVYLSGDVLLKGEKCADDFCKLPRVSLEASKHNEITNACAKDFISLDKTLLSLEARVDATCESVNAIKEQETIIRNHAENCMDVFEVIKRLQSL